MQITFPVFNSVEITCIGSRDYTSKNRDEAAIASLYDLELLNNEICKFLSGNVTVLEMLRFFLSSQIEALFGYNAIKTVF